MKPFLSASLGLILTLLPNLLFATEEPRARDLGVPFEGTPGPHNAITDVAGVQVGHTTIISGEGKMEPGKGPVRTGVTAILPRGHDLSHAVAAGRAVINGTGEMTGSWVIDEMGAFTGPIMLTGTTSVGRVHQATSQWIRDNQPAELWSAGLIPVVTETLDSHLNDIWGFHVSADHVYSAIDNATGGPVREGNVGGGTGMIAYTFKGGIGTASRQIEVDDGQIYTIGVLLQANHGKRHELRIAGAPVGQEISDLWPTRDPLSESKSSLVLIIATDIPFSPGQLQRLARRASLGVGRNGSTASYMSGEIALAFSTTHTFSLGDSWHTRPNPTAMHGELLNKSFAATVQAVEEALVNMLVAAETMTGANNLTVYALPHDRLQQALAKYNRLATRDE